MAIKILREDYKSFRMREDAYSLAWRGSLKCGREGYPRTLGCKGSPRITREESRCSTLIIKEKNSYIG